LVSHGTADTVAGRTAKVKPRPKEAHIEVVVQVALFAKAPGAKRLLQVLNYQGGWCLKDAREAKVEEAPPPQEDKEQPKEPEKPAQASDPAATASATEDAWKEYSKPPWKKGWQARPRW
jgi:hypothetical protein